MMVGRTVRIIRKGRCNKCGDCCRHETLPARIQAYEKAGIPYKIINVNCGCFDTETGLCKNYKNRPSDCRDFPLRPVDILVLPRCGYFFIAVKE